MKQKPSSTSADSNAATSSVIDPENASPESARDKLMRAREIADDIRCKLDEISTEEISADQAVIMDNCCGELVELVDHLFASCRRHRPETWNVGGSKMTRLLATVYMRSWEVVLDTSLPDGSPIRIREARSQEADSRSNAVATKVRAVIGSLEEDLEHGYSLVDTSGSEVGTRIENAATDPVATQQALKAVCDSLALATGRDVFIVPERISP